MLRSPFSRSAATEATSRSARRVGWRGWLARIAIVVALLATLAYLAVGTYVVTTLTRPNRLPLATTPAAYGLAYQDVQVPSRDGLTLAGWYIPASGSDRAIILVHGKDSNRTEQFGERFLELASPLHKAGYNVLYIDLRGHGASQGERFTLGEHERWDVLGAVDWLKGRGVKRIGALGVSLGAASIVEAAVDPQGGPAIEAIVLDSVFGDMRKTLDQEFPEASGLPVAFLPGALFMGQVLFGVDMGAIRPTEDLPRIKAPVMLIFGEQDQTVPLVQFYANAAARPDAETWLVPGVDHARIYNARPDEYIRRVVSFFDRSLR